MCALLVGLSDVTVIGVGGFVTALARAWSGGVSTRFFGTPPPIWGDIMAFSVLMSLPILVVYFAFLWAVGRSRSPKARLGKSTCRRRQSLLTL